jgi:hypothetical protein
MAAGRSRGSELGRYFARQSWLEAASVHAFGRLAAELRQRRAPDSLARAAERAAQDEVRHARATAALARRHRASPPPVRIRKQPRRTLEAFALENMIEGCVRESWAALLALWQAKTAADPLVRRTMAAIAPDEVRHAELAWAVDAWARPRLSAKARARVTAASDAALAELASERAPSAVDSAIGLPSGRSLRTLYAAFEADVRRRAAA